MAILVHDRGFWITHTLEGHIFDEELCHAIGDSMKRCGCRTVADCGCGPGWYVKFPGDRGFDIRGFDGNPFTSSLSRSLFGSSIRCESLDFTHRSPLMGRSIASLPFSFGFLIECF